MGASYRLRLTLRSSSAGGQGHGDHLTSGPDSKSNPLVAVLGPILLLCKALAVTEVACSK